MLSKTLRRTDRALSEEDTRKVLARCQWGTLSYADDEGTLHSIPISYAVAGDNLYFHGGKAGTKWETLQKPRAATFVVATRQGRSGRIHDCLRFRRALGHGRTRLGRSRTPHGILCGAREILRDGRPRKVRRLLPRRKSLRRSLAPSHRMHDGQAPRVSAISESLFR